MRRRFCIDRFGQSKINNSNLACIGVVFISIKGKKILMMITAASLLAGCHGASSTEDAQALTSLDDGNLQVESLFGSAISNPDCNMEDGENTASLQIRNVSGKYLAHGRIEVSDDKGTTYTFVVDDVPDQSEIVLFDTGNQQLPSGNVTAVRGTADTSYTDETSLLNNGINAADTDGVISLQNQITESYDNLQVTYHTVMDDLLYGGTSYTTDSGQLAAGESVMLDTSEAWTGEAQIVRIEK